MAELRARWHRGSKAWALVVTAIAALVLFARRPAEGGNGPLTFYVDDAADLSDRFAGDRLCQTVERRCTLRAAIEEANAQSPGTGTVQIQLLPGAVHRLTHADAATVGSEIGPTALPVRVPMSIIGSGGTIERASGADAFRIFRIDAGASLQLANVTIAGGKTPDLLDAGDQAGGGIYNLGELVVTGSTLRDHEAGEPGGGALYNEGMATLVATEVASSLERGFDFHGHGGGGVYNRGNLALLNSVVHDNSTSGGDFGGDGGGIYNAGEATVRDSAFYRNGTFAGCAGGHGAAIFSDGDLSVGRSAFSENATSRGGDGGAIFNAGAAEIVDAEFRENEAGDASEDLPVGRGGAIGNSGELVVVRCTVAANSSGNRDWTSPGDGGDGGGIFNIGTLRLRDSTIEGNRTGRGGTRTVDHGGHGAGIFNAGLATLVNATISGNRAGSGGSECLFSEELKPSAGGSGGGLHNTGTAMLFSVTIAENAAGGGGFCDEEGAVPGLDGLGGGIFAAAPPARLEANGVVVAGNSAEQSGRDCSGTLEGSFNLIEVGTGCAVDAGNIVDEAALLGPLSDNGGPTLTHALLPDSPAVDGGDPAGCRDADGTTLLADQRGAPRPSTAVGRCDLGAFELESTRLPTPTVSPQPATPTQTPTTAVSSGGGGGCAAAPRAAGSAASAWLLLLALALVRSLIRK